MEQNKVRTYIFYAIGEIALVMIGILLALQVNNWNEERKEIRMQDFYLNKLKQNLMQDTTNYQESIDIAEGHISDIVYLSEAIQDPQLSEFEVRPDLPLISTIPFMVSSATWENLQATGNISLIQNEELSENLYNYYSSAIINNQGMSDAIASYSRTVLGPFLMEFDQIALSLADSSLLSFEFYQKSPAEYGESLLYKNGLSFKLNTFMDLVGLINDQKGQALGLLTLIEKELAD